MLSSKENEIITKIQECELNLWETISKTTVFDEKLLCDFYNNILQHVKEGLKIFCEFTPGKDLFTEFEYVFYDKIRTVNTMATYIYEYYLQFIIANSQKRLEEFAGLPTTINKYLIFGDFTSEICSTIKDFYTYIKSDYYDEFRNNQRSYIKHSIVFQQNIFNISLPNKIIIIIKQIKQNLDDAKKIADSSHNMHM